MRFINVLGSAASNCAAARPIHRRTWHLEKEIRPFSILYDL